MRHKAVRVLQNIVVEPWTGAFSSMTTLTSWQARPGILKRTCFVIEGKTVTGKMFGVHWHTERVHVGPRRKSHLVPSTLQVRIDDAQQRPCPPAGRNWVTFASEHASTRNAESENAKSVEETRCRSEASLSRRFPPGRHQGVNG